MKWQCVQNRYAFLALVDIILKSCTVRGSIVSCLLGSQIILHPQRLLLRLNPTNFEKSQYCKLVKDGLKSVSVSITCIFSEIRWHRQVEGYGPDPYWHFQYVVMLTTYIYFIWESQQRREFSYELTTSGATNTNYSFYFLNLIRKQTNILVLQLYIQIHIVTLQLSTKIYSSLKW